MRVLVVANLAKRDVRPALDEWLPIISKQVEVLGVDEATEDDLSSVLADVILVLGGWDAALDGAADSGTADSAHGD